MAPIDWFTYTQEFLRHIGVCKGYGVAPLSPHAPSSPIKDGSYTISASVEGHKASLLPPHDPTKGGYMKLTPFFNLKA